MNKKYTGRCACGAVTYGFDTEPTVIANCHCTDCKRASGGEMATFMAVPDTDFTMFTGNGPGTYTPDYWTPLTIGGGRGGTRFRRCGCLERGRNCRHRAAAFRHQGALLWPISRCSSRIPQR